MKGPSRSTYATSRLSMPVNEDDHIRGPEDAPVTLVEYGDYECPYCGAAYPIIQQLIKTHGSEVRFVYRHFPLTEIHPHAEIAAEASEAAGEQEKFWEMHDTLFEHQHKLDEVSLASYADQLGLDVVRFSYALEEGFFEPRVERDFISGLRSGVGGTPTFFINGIKHEGMYDLHTLSNAIRSAAGTAKRKSHV